MAKTYFTHSIKEQHLETAWIPAKEVIGLYKIVFADACRHTRALIMETYPGTKSQYNPALPLFQVKDGYITVPDKPGLGIDPDPTDIKKYRGN